MPVYVRSRMEHTYAYLFRLRANAKTALFRATSLLIVSCVPVSNGGCLGTTPAFVGFSWVQAAVGGIAK